MSLGSKINESRKQKGLSIDELCEKSGIPKGTLSKITAGITASPTLDTVRAIANALECRLDDLDDSSANAKKEAPLYSSEALRLAQDYDGLDEHGKRIVRLVADEEKARCAEQAKVKLYIATRDGSRIETEIDSDVTLPESTELPE